MKNFKLGVLGLFALTAVACGGGGSDGSSTSSGTGALGGTGGGAASGGAASGGVISGGGGVTPGAGGATAGVGGGAPGGGGILATGGAASGGTGGGAGLPERIVGGYWATWPESQIRLVDVPEAYNLIYLFAAVPVGGPPGTTGAVEWQAPGDGRGAATNFKADLEHVRTVQGRTVILSVGGAGQGMSFPTREKSQNFVDSVTALYDEWGGFDGLDWNTFEADQEPDTEEMIWISLELKKQYPGFIISAPPAPWNSIDKTFCKAMVDAGAMDYAAPQYYDGPGLNAVDYLKTNVDEWVDLVGEEHLVIGFGIWDQTNYWSTTDAISGWNQVSAAHANLLGTFAWAIHIDEMQDWPYANQLAPVVNP